MASALSKPEPTPVALSLLKWKEEMRRGLKRKTGEEKKDHAAIQSRRRFQNPSSRRRLSSSRHPPRAILLAPSSSRRPPRAILLAPSSPCSIHHAAAHSQSSVPQAPSLFRDLHSAAGLSSPRTATIAAAQTVLCQEPQHRASLCHCQQPRPEPEEKERRPDQRRKRERNKEEEKESRERKKKEENEIERRRDEEENTGRK